MAVAEETIAPDAVKPVLQHVDQEAADELSASATFSSIRQRPQSQQKLQE